MATAARLDLTVERNDDIWEFALTVRGLDLSTTALAMEIRSREDAPGPAAITLAKVSNAEAEGLRVASVVTVAGSPETDLRIRLSKASRQALPYGGEMGSVTELAYAMLIAGVTRLKGSVFVQPTAYGSDNAPTDRLPSYAARPAAGGASAAILTINNGDSAVLELVGLDAVSPLVDRAIQARTDAVAAAASLAAKVEAADNLYDPTKNQASIYITSDGRLDTGPTTWSMGIVPVVAGQSYAVYLANMTSTAFPFAGLYSTSTNVNDRILGAMVGFAPTSDPNVFTFTVPTGQNIAAAFFNVKVASVDVAASFIVRPGNSVPVRPLPYTPEIVGLGDRGLRDATARKGLLKLSGAYRYVDKTIYAFGDSTVEGTQGGYMQDIAAATGAIVINYGSSGARASRLVGIITDQPRRDVTGPQFPVRDYTGVAASFIAIGTNDSYDAGGSAVTGSMASIPKEAITDLPYSYTAPNGSTVNVTTPAQHWARFADSFYGNLALCIEYMLWKNPTMRIFLVVNPHLYDQTNKQPLLGRMNAVAAAMLEIGAYYSVEVIQGQRDSGMSPKLGMTWRYDGTHFNALGNRVFGTFLGYRILNA